MANQTQFSHCQIGAFCQIVLSFFYEMRKAARAARKFSDQMAYQTQLSSLKIGNCRQIAPLIFYEMRKAARALEEFCKVKNTNARPGTLQAAPACNAPNPGENDDTRKNEEKKRGEGLATGNQNGYG